MKHFTQNLRWLLMSLMLVVGLVSAWGADVTANVPLSSGTFSTDHITWNLDNAVTVQQFKCSSSIQRAHLVVYGFHRLYNKKYFYNLYRLLFRKLDDSRNSLVK